MNNDYENDMKMIGRPLTVYEHKSESSELTGLLSSADEYIDGLERKIRFDLLENPWNRAWRPTETEIAEKKAAWLSNRSIAELKGR